MQVRLPYHGGLALKFDDASEDWRIGRGNPTCELSVSNFQNAGWEDDGRSRRSNLVQNYKIIDPIIRKMSRHQDIHALLNARPITRTPLKQSNFRETKPCGEVKNWRKDPAPSAMRDVLSRETDHLVIGD